MKKLNIIVMIILISLSHFSLAQQANTKNDEEALLKQLESTSNLTPVTERVEL